MKNHKKIFGCICVITLLAGILRVYGYFQDMASVDNFFQIGGNRVELVEEFQQPDILASGSVITKRIQVKNMGISECYVRIRAEFTSNDMKELCNVDWNEEDWIKGDDDFYYYRYILESQEVTNPLFSEVVIQEGVAETQIQPFDILVYAESYQAEEESDYESIWRDFCKNNPENEVK